MLSLKDKRKDYKFWGDIGVKDISIFEKISDSKFICIFDNIVPVYEGMIFDYESIKDRIKPIDPKYNSKINISLWTSESIIKKFPINFVIKNDDVELRFEEEFIPEDYVGKYIRINNNHIYRVCRRDNEVEIYTETLSYTSTKEDIVGLLKYMIEKEPYRFINHSIDIIDPKIELELF